VKRRRRRVVLTAAQARLLARERVSRVATAGAGGMPHVVPVCHVVAGGRLYFASGDDGQKVVNLRANPRVCLVVDIYSEDWSRLAGVMVQGRARLVEGGAAFRRLRARLYAKYPQYARAAALAPSDSVIVELVPTHVFAWGVK